MEKFVEYLEDKTIMFRGLECAYDGLLYENGQYELLIRHTYDEVEYIISRVICTTDQINFI